MNLTEYVIVSDFDGTIICEDSNGLLFRLYGNTESAKIEEDFRAGALGTRPAMIKHFDILRITLERYYDFLDTNIHVDPGFDAFLCKVQEHCIAFFIVSAGFNQAISHLIGSEQLSEVYIFANDLTGEQYLKPSFVLDDPVCVESIGPCGNCKKSCIKTIREQTGKKIIFIGDGLTDRCAAHQADLLFAKNDLSLYCDAQSLPYKPFKSFSDIERYLFPEKL